MSTPFPSPGRSEEERHPTPSEPGTDEVSFITPTVTGPTSEHDLAVGAAATGAISAPMSGVDNVSFAVIGRRLTDLWRTVSRNPKALFGLCVVTLFVLVAIFGPVVLHNDPNALSSDTLQPPSVAHWLGTTQTGQDVFTQLVYGTRSSVFWGFLTGILVTILSVTVGLTAGYFGSIIDESLSLLVNIFLVLPALPLAIVLATFIPYKGPLSVVLVITVTSWAFGARVLRAQALSLRHRDFVEAARSSGESTSRIIFFEILPNEIALVASGFVGTVLFVILSEAGLEFIGLGNVTVVSWGTMFYWSFSNDALVLGAWWWFVPPGLCIALLGAALAFMNFGIDEIANPLLQPASDLKAH